MECSHILPGSAYRVWPVDYYLSLTASQVGLCRCYDVLCMICALIPKHKTFRACRWTQKSGAARNSECLIFVQGRVWNTLLASRSLLRVSLDLSFLSELWHPDLLFMGMLPVWNHLAYHYLETCNMIRIGLICAQLISMTTWLSWV